MKKNNKSKIDLKKLVIARVSRDSMNRIKGGSSVHTGPRHTAEGDCITDP
ncbi:hypothetical protein [Aquimarina litoralis]|nr:hypothetical protein [Aquimarina litoralis]